jgi:hypothetical protein
MGPIYYGGQPKPSHGFSRSPSILVVAKCGLRSFLNLQLHVLRHEACFEISPSRTTWKMLFWPRAFPRLH